VARRSYFVYILTNQAGTLYVGVTNNLERRIIEHKQAAVDSFTKRYKIDRLVYYEETNDVEAAITREKQIKGCLRRRKVELIDSFNPAWADLGEELLDKKTDSSLRSE
jgi:putative endonuclease